VDLTTHLHLLIVESQQCQTEFINFRPRFISEYALSSRPVDRRLLCHQQGNARRKGGFEIKGKGGDERTRSRLEVRIRGRGY
jgi:hypothetical protein